MKTKDFFNVLKVNNNKSLLFEYKPKELVAANYHITEVKHIKVDSVDCGAQKESWNETVIQLWESPSEKGKTEFMSVEKASAILKKVGHIKTYDLESEVKFEYSNANFHTAQLFVNDFEIHGENLIIKLAIEKTDCKAKELCGIPEQVVDLAENSVEKVESCCSPSSGCC